MAMLERRLLAVVYGTLALVFGLLASGELEIVSTYPDSHNFSYIELVCVDDSEPSNVSQSGVIGASFQLNGTDIEEEIDSVETVADANSTNSTIRFLLTQEKEGFFTCSLNGSSSNNSIGLAGIYKELSMSLKLIHLYFSSQLSPVLTILGCLRHVKWCYIVQLLF